MRPSLLIPALWLIGFLSPTPCLMARMGAGSGGARTVLPPGLDLVDWKQIRAEYERHRHAFFPDAAGFHARSFHQRWMSRFDERGFVVEPDAGGWTWGLERVTAAGLRARLSKDVNRLTYHWGDGVDEWFVNDTRGLEHGFTLVKPLEIRLRVCGSLQARGEGEGLEFFDGSGVVRMRYSGLKAWDSEGRPVPARMRGNGGEILVRVDDRGARYPITVDPIAQQAYLKASNADAVDFFGSSVAIAGDTVVVGAPGEASYAQTVNGDQALNGSTRTGAAYVFVRTGNAWTQQAYLKAANADMFDDFGSSVAVSGDTAVVGAPSEDSNARTVNGASANNAAPDSGAAYVFVRSGGVWTQQAYLKASNAEAGDKFGASVAASADVVVVGALLQGVPAAPLSGAAYVFVRSGSVWTQEGYLKASNAGPLDWFGTSVAVSGDTAVVGARLEGSNARTVNGDGTNDAALASGAAYVFVRNGGSWSQQAYLKSSNADAGDTFGDSVAVSGDTVVVGASDEDSSARTVNGDGANNAAQVSGAAYVFVRSGGVWTQQAYLKASDADSYARFGQSVAVSGDTVVVGASGAKSASKESGAAYVFVRSGGVWAQRTSLNASNADRFDHFGVAVAASGDKVIVGADAESSNTRRVDGDGADNSAPASGAAYVFDNLPAAPSIAVPLPGQSLNVSGIGFQWTSLPFAAGYNLSITRSGNTVFEGNLLGQSATSTLITLPDGTYIFAVRGCSATTFDASTCGAFATVTFTVAQTAPASAPSITSPAGGQNFTSSTQTFSWTSVANVSSYQVELRDQAIGAVELSLANSGDPPATDTIYSMHASTNYALRVRACQPACGPWSATVNFSVTLPPVPTAAPAAPSCSLTGNRLNCSWNGVANADFYTIHAIHPTAFNGGALTVASRRTTALTTANPEPPMLVPDGPLAAIVAGCNGNGCGPYSSAASVNAAAGNPASPVLGNPVPGSVVLSNPVFFSWNRIPGDNGSNTVYRLYVQDFSRAAPALDVYTTANFYAAAFRGEGSRYDAVVVANPGSPSQVVGSPAGFNVIAASPASPTMVQPAHVAPGMPITIPSGNVTLGWTPVPGATLYEYFVAVTGQPNASARGVTPGLLVQVPLPVTANTNYSGIVRACPAGATCAFGSDAGWGPWSNAAGGSGVTSFTVRP